MTRHARPRHTRIRQRRLVLLAIAAATAVTGCSTTSTGAVATGSPSGSTAATSTGSSTGSSPTASGLSTPSSPAATPGATTTSATHPPACTGGQLRVTAGTVSAGAGQRYVPLVFTNVGPLPCTLYGYPGVAGLDSAGHQVAQARRESGWPRATITLAHAAAASAVVHATVVPTGTATCPPQYAGLLVTPPNTTFSVHLAVPLPACGGLTVRPVVAGTSGM
jgi:Protein of unknown function (DUF4232)